MSLLVWRGPTNALIPTPDSGGWVGTDRIRATDIYMGSYACCAANLLARGTFGSGGRLGWVVNQCTLSKQRGGIGKLVIEWEAGGAYATNPLPIGGFSLTPQELYPKIERAGCFLDPDEITFQTLNLCKCAIDLATNSSGSPLISGTFLTDNIADGKNGYTSVTAPIQLALAQKLVDKWKKGEETFYLAGWRYTYEVFSYTKPAINKGGVPETPAGPLADSLPADVSWLRLADSLDPAGVAGSMYKLTVTYLGGPNMGGTSYWDPDVYP